jgi:UPF0755 protein
MTISTKKFIFGLGFFFLITLIGMIVAASRVPKNFPIGQFDINIPLSSSLDNISNKLESKRIISSPFLFKVLIVIFGGGDGIFAGDYRFTEGQNAFTIASRLTAGQHGLPKVKITIPEGTNVYDMAYIYLTKLTNFNAPKFVALALREEGYLFPDTYFFFSNTKPEAIIKEMRANFDKKISTLTLDTKPGGRTLKDIIIMASIVEEEARGLEDKKIVAGILWKRLDDNMLLQVDAPFYYLTAKKGSFTLDDLKIDSPYNTYLYKGLTKGPISNPGLESIMAAINPVKTKYYFYLTGKDGKMRYASTYDGHIQNKNIYLN